MKHEQLILALHHTLSIGSQFGLTFIGHANSIEILAALVEVLGYFVLRQTVDANLVIQSCHGCNLLLTVESLSIHPTLQFGTLLCIGTIEGVDEHVGLLVRSNVAADSLAEYLRVAINVKIVILQLESSPNL